MKPPKTLSALHRAIIPLLSALFVLLCIYYFFKPAPLAPDFTIKDLSGKTISLSGLKGKVILLDFWGVWCGPCRQKLPHTQKIHDQFKDKNLAVIGIHSAFGTEETAGFITENNYTFPTAIDPGHIAEDYKVNAWPTYFLIDKNGRLAWGPQHSPPSEKLIKSLLEKSSSALPAK